MASSRQPPHREPSSARPSFAFSVEGRDGQARSGTLHTRRGPVPTPVFMPVGTQGTVKGLRPDELYAQGARVLLVNAYHLNVRPGVEVVEAAGGINRFMGWPGVTLADSGGFQVFSLSSLVKVSDEGVTFRSHVDGSRFFMTPEDLIDVQRRLGADIVMPLDECVPYPCEVKAARVGLQRTNAWAARSLERFEPTGQALFGIVQGSTDEDLRKRAADTIGAMAFDGCAVGGVSVGEGPKLARDVLGWTLPRLPVDKPRYVMGLGRPEDLLDAVALGADMFDCVLPTRNGRNGQAFTFDGIVRIKNACYTSDRSSLEAGCPCYACRNFGRDFLRHLFMAREMLGPMLLSLHNVVFFQRLMAQARQAIVASAYQAFRLQFLERYQRHGARA